MHDGLQLREFEVNFALHTFFEQVLIFTEISAAILCLPNDRS
jgi:hypothetical protein